MTKTIKLKNEYFSTKKHDVLENKVFINVFKKTIFGNLCYWKGFAKEYYEWKEDNNMFIITSKQQNKNN